MKDKIKAFKKTISERHFHYKVLLAVWAVVGALAVIAWAFRAVNEWSALNKVVLDWPMRVSFHKVVRIEKREPLQVLSPLAKEVIEEQDSVYANLSPIKKKICDLWGPYECKVAIAVAEHEGLNHPADDWNTNTNGTIDVGYFRINSVHFNQEGCSLAEVITEDGNLKCAYGIWKKQGWGPWVAFINGNFKQSL